MVEVFRKVLPKGAPVPVAEAKAPAEIERLEEALLLAHRHNAELHPDRAIAMFRRALELDPTNAQAAGELGSTMIDAGQAQAGFRFFDEFLAVHPRSAEVRLAYAGGLLRVGELERAVAECRVCLEHRPNWDAPYPPLIRALQRLERREEARQALGAYRPLAKDPRILELFDRMLG